MSRALIRSVPYDKHKASTLVSSRVCSRSTCRFYMCLTVGIRPFDHLTRLLMTLFFADL